MSVRLGAYELLGHLGEGGMGVVYRARHLSLGGEYALKTIPLDSDPEALARARREGQAMAQLSGHPHVVSVHTLFEDQGQLCLVMELCPGGDLEGRLGRGPLAPEEAARILAAVASGLAAAHEAGILHRDLKPGNVLFDEAGVPKLTDFGIARVADGNSLTQTGSLLGTPSYMSPEQAEGRPSDPRSDVYGLGAILYQCLAGAPPFGPGPVLAVLSQVVHEPPPPLPAGVPAPLAKTCLRALAKDPADRPQSAQEFLRELESAPEAGLERALRLAGGALGLVILVLAGVLAQRGLSGRTSAAAAASPEPSARESPEVTETPHQETPAETPRPSPSAPAREDPWLLTLPPWPDAPGDRATDPAEVTEISRRVARFPPLAGSAWRARGLRTHAAPRPEAGKPLSEFPGPPWEFFARAFQDLERNPTHLTCLSAASAGFQTDSIRSANGVRGHGDFGRWLLFRATCTGSMVGLRQLRNGFVPLGLEGQDLSKSALDVHEAWRRTGEPTPEVQAAWGRLEAYARRRYAEPLRELMPADRPSHRPRDGDTSNRAMAELASRSWELAFLLEAATQDLQGRDMPSSPSGNRYQLRLVQAAGGALRGDFNMLRFLGQRLRNGAMGCERDAVTGKLLLFLAVQESTERDGHALYNLGHGSTRESLESMGTRRYEPWELACLVLSDDYERTAMVLKNHRALEGAAPLPSAAEADLLFLEEQARVLDEAGLLGRPATAYGGPPELPAGEPHAPHGPSLGICLQLRNWIPHSLLLRTIAREAAQLPAMTTEERRRLAKSLRSTDLRLAHLLRGALESDRMAARQFIEELSQAPIEDPVLRARLLIACAFLGQPRVFRGFDPALKDLGPTWQRRAAEVRSCAARVYWESEGLERMRAAGIALEAAPPLPEAWRRLRAFDAELAQAGVLQRLNEWTAGPYLPGEPRVRVRRAVRRLAIRHRRVAEALTLEEREGESQEAHLLRGASRGRAGQLLNLAAYWGKEERYRLARGALILGLEAMPRGEWGIGVPVAKALWLDDLAKCLEELAREPSPEAWRVFHRERELALMGAGLPSLADLDAWGVPR